MRSPLAILGFLLAFTASPHVHAAEAGDVVQATNVGVPLYTRNFTKGTSTSIADKLFITQFIGAHYFVTNTIRVGMMVQFTEQFAGDLTPGSDHFTTFALLPQVGWNFYDHFSAAAIFTWAPRAGGKAQYDLGVQALIGYSVPITSYAAFNAALEIPYNFRLAQTLGVTPLVGLSYRL